MKHNMTLLAGGFDLVRMRHLKIDRVKTFPGGKERVLYNFSPSPHGVPEEFLAIPDAAWRDCGPADLCGAMRRYVERRRDGGEAVELSVSDGGIVCFEYVFNGERRSLWFNVYTSDAIVIDAEGKVCKDVNGAIASGEPE